MIGFWGVLIAAVVWAVARLFPSSPNGPAGNRFVDDDGLPDSARAPKLDDTSASASAEPDLARK